MDGLMQELVERASAYVRAAESGAGEDLYFRRMSRSLREAAEALWGDED